MVTSLKSIQRSSRLPSRTKKKHPMWHGFARNGAARSSEYRTWASMIQRCTNAKRSNFPHYGGRGIQVCKRWKISFKAFLKDMGRKPSPHHTLDRKDVNGNYTPSNCRWATLSEQNSNKRKFDAP